MPSVLIFWEGFRFLSGPAKKDADPFFPPGPLGIRFFVEFLCSVVQWLPFSFFFGGCPTKMVFPKMGPLFFPGSLNN